MAKRKTMQKGCIYFDDFEGLISNIEKGKSVVYADNRDKIHLDINENKVYMTFDYIEDDIRELLSCAELLDADTYFEEYELDYDDFAVIFGYLIEAKRLTYPKKQ